MYTFSFMDTPFSSPLLFCGPCRGAGHTDTLTWKSLFQQWAHQCPGTEPHGPSRSPSLPTPPGLCLCHNPINIPFTVTQSSRQMNLFSKSIKRDLIKRNVGVFVFQIRRKKKKKKGTVARVCLIKADFGHSSVQHVAFIECCPVW